MHLTPAARRACTAVLRRPSRRGPRARYVGRVTGTSVTAVASFGEQGGLLTYGSYLRVPELLAQQVPESDPPAHDELLFITIHQVYELWFQLLLAELTDARDRMLAGEAYMPRVRLERCHAIERVLVGQVDVIDTMTPQDFLAFRTKLAPASGFPVRPVPGDRVPVRAEGRELPGPVPGLTPRPSGTRLRRRLDEPSLWDGYLALLAKARVRRRRPPRSGSTRTRTIARDRDAVTARCGTWPRRWSTTTRPGRCGAPATCSWPSARSAQARHRRLGRRRVPALAHRAALLPRALGAPQPPLTRHDPVDR